MSDILLVRHCSPTLAGIKPGSMFSCTYETEDELRSEIRRINKMLVPKGIYAMVLRSRQGRALIYVFRPKALEPLFRDRTAVSLLSRRGYGEMRLAPCICQLKKRVQENEEFPHEIGLFLGYPPEDVCGFIENKACNQKCVGCWKVYGDADAAQKTFRKYKICTEIYCSQWEQGTSIERLAVAG